MTAADLVATAIDQILAADGVWGEHPAFPRKQWHREAISGNTNLGYWEWARAQILPDAPACIILPDAPACIDGDAPACIDGEDRHRIQLLQRVADSALRQIADDLLTHGCQLGDDEPASPSLALVRAAASLCGTIEATGGILVDDAGQCTGVAVDEDWLDLADAAELAESALAALGIAGRDPRYTLTKRNDDTFCQWPSHT